MDMLTRCCDDSEEFDTFVESWLGKKIEVKALLIPLSGMNSGTYPMKCICKSPLPQSETFTA